MDVGINDGRPGSNAQLTDLLRGRLREVSAIVEQRGEVALAGTPLSLPLNHLLDAVVAEPAVTVTELARRLGKTQQAMSLAADRLESLGLIERRVGSGRTVALHATASGKSASAEAVAKELEAEDDLRRIIGPEQYGQLLTLLALARDRLSSVADGETRD